jgi:hypothetical protein
MEVAEAAIYMGFCPFSCRTRSQSRIQRQSNFNLLFWLGFGVVSVRNTSMGNFISVSSFLNPGRKELPVLGCY